MRYILFDNSKCYEIAVTCNISSLTLNEMKDPFHIKRNQLIGNSMKGYKYRSTFNKTGATCMNQSKPDWSDHNCILLEEPGKSIGIWKILGGEDDHLYIPIHCTWVLQRIGFIVRPNIKH